MARCRCQAEMCTCVVQAGTGIVVDGVGTATAPWVVSLICIDCAGGDTGDTLLLGADGIFRPAVPPGGFGLTNGDKGDITIAGSGASLTIDNGAVTPAKLSFAVPPVRRPVTINSGSFYGPFAADENTMIALTNSGSIVITMPSNATTAIPIGAEIDWLWWGTGQPSFVAGSGATIGGTPGLKLRARYSAATTKKIDTNDWVLIGDLAS